ncbi:MAG TPA: helix-turn-helix transcriptional regulator [Streptosporangiaceae bacterium]|jgi:transcriptional regulator with XRE-family HTH domain
MGRDGQVSALALFSEELRRARGAAGLTQDQLAERVGYSPSLVAHVETGSRAPSLDFARRGDEALGTDGLLARLQPFVRSEAYPAWFRDWVEIERLIKAARQPRSCFRSCRWALGRTPGWMAGLPSPVSMARPTSPISTMPWPDRSLSVPKT